MFCNRTLTFSLPLSDNLGRSYLESNNVSASNGNLQIKLPANTLRVGELVSNDLYGYGSYSARMKLPNAPASIAGFFLYQPLDYASEIDIEIYNDPSRRIIFSTYSGGRQTHSQTLKLPFDPRPTTKTTASTAPPAP